MATYKVLQDIEAEDTLIGPLTLRQCIYAAIAIVAIYLSVVFVSKHVAFMVIFMLPFIAFGIFFAFPWSKQQSTEVWALAKIRFMLKPRKRIWNQSGVKELVTITVPKNIKRVYASTLTPTEVSSRLKALADTIDSRGWAIKNVDLGYYRKASVMGAPGSSDRLVDQSSLPREVPNINVTDAEDIFDVKNNAVAQKFDAMMSQSAGAHRQQLLQQMAQPSPQKATFQPTQPSGQPTDNFWHMRAIAPLPAATNAPVAAPSSPVPDMSLPAPVRPGQSVYAPAVLLQDAAASLPNLAMRTPSIQPPIAAKATVNSAQPADTSQNQMTAHANPAILELANNNDLDIATIAREAQARTPDADNEITISLH